MKRFHPACHKKPCHACPLFQRKLPWTPSCGRWRLLRTASATIRAGLDVRLCDAWFSPRIQTIIVAVSFHLRANPIHQTVMQTHVVICALSPPSLLHLVSNPPPLLPSSESCKRAGRQNAKQEHNTHSFTFLCASLPPVHSQSACPTATPVHPRGREYTEVQPPLPLHLCRVLVTHFESFSTRSVVMTHNPVYEPWLHCWSLRTHHTTHILSYQSVEPVPHHTDTCCEQTHRSSRCRRYRNLC